MNVSNQLNKGMFTINGLIFIQKLQYLYWIHTKMNGKEKEFESSKMVAYCKDCNGNIFVEI